MKKRFLIATIIYILLLALTLIISWLAFPDWAQKQGGFWELFGKAAVADLAFVGAVAALWEQVRKSGNEGKTAPSQSSPPTPPLAPQQTATNGVNVGRDMRDSVVVLGNNNIVNIPE